MTYFPLERGQQHAPPTTAAPVGPDNETWTPGCTNPQVLALLRAPMRASGLALAESGSRTVESLEARELQDYGQVLRADPRRGRGATVWVLSEGQLEALQRLERKP